MTVRRTRSSDAVGAPNDLQALVSLSGLVPTVCVVMGSSAGHGALTAPLMDFVVMVEGAALFSAGPPLVQAAIGEEITKEALGGTPVHTVVSGVAHNQAPDDEAALDARAAVPLVPPVERVGASTVRGGRRHRSSPGRRAARPHPGRSAPRVRRALGHRCRVRRGTVCSRSRRRSAARSSTAFARLGGEAIAVVANQPAVKAGSIDADSADKAAHFLEIADAFHLPVVFLADNPGVLAGSAVGAQRDPASRGTDVRGAGPRDEPEAARDPAQGLRLRQLAHGDEPVRRPDGHPRAPGHAASARCRPTAAPRR